MSAVIVTADADSLYGCQMIRRWSAGAACGRSASILLHPGGPEAYCAYYTSSSLSSQVSLLRALFVIAAAMVSQLEILCCVHGYVPTVGLFREMDLFAFICHVDPTKVRIEEQGGQNDNVEVVGPYELNEEGGGTKAGDQTEESDCVVQDEVVNIVVDEDVQDVVADKPKRTRKKSNAASGASGSNLPPKKLRKDHDTSGDVGASIIRKSLSTLQGLLEHSTLAEEISVTAVATVPFGTSFVTPTPERKGGRHTDSVFGPNFRTRHLVERSPIPPPLVMTVAVIATIVAATSSALVLGAAARINELNKLKEQSLALEGKKSTLEGRVAMLESTNACKDTELVSKDSLTNQVSVLETPCSELRDQVTDYELYKEQYKVDQDERVKILSDRVAELDSKLIVYVDALVIAIGLVIDKGMQSRLVVEWPAGVLLRFLPMFLPWRKAMGPLVDPLSSENLFDEASISSVPTTAATTTTLSISVTTANVSCIQPISVANYEVLNTEASHSPNIVFEQETLETSPEHPTTN
uniref:Uncharacterized protein n=1 Tax=Tanacetum cinerariifolium TaxID=118510 RepID=A0A699GZ80_TANCI|nr:hypothetical protein [Tanacetum cinerariifolium]